MPNHVTTVLEAPSVVIDALYVDEHLDFNSVIPMPPDDDPIFTATKHNYGNGMVAYSVDGYSPMEWARANWGTKWNAYDVEREFGTQVQFDTAWAHPLPVIEALSRKFPDISIEVKYADENLGYNLGHYKIRDGEVSAEIMFFDGSPAALDFATQIKYRKTYAELRDDF